MIADPIIGFFLLIFLLWGMAAISRSSSGNPSDGPSTLEWIILGLSLAHLMYFMKRYWRPRRRLRIQQRRQLPPDDEEW